MEVEVEFEVVAQEDGIGIEVGTGLKGLDGEGMLEFDSHFDGLLDVYWLIFHLLLVEGLDRGLLYRVRKYVELLTLLDEFLFGREEDPCG